MHAEKCPVCDGKGTIPSNDMCSTLEVACHGCNGLGWVQVENSLSEQVDYAGIWRKALY